MNGVYKINKKKIQFSKGISTLMACQNMEVEDKVAKFLEGEKKMTWTSSKLVLLNENNTESLTFERIK